MDCGDSEVQLTRDEGQRKVLLRDLPTSDRCFWTETHDNQVRQSVYDKTVDGTNRRELPANEVSVMALNEVAARHGRGFFFHILGRDGWKKAAGGGSSRALPQPGASFPALVYIDYVWSERGRERFFGSAHRARYLACDALLNPPPSATPVYCFQYAAHGTCPLYATSHASFIILQTASAFYLLPLGDLEAILGRWPKSKKQPAGPEPEQRLDTLPELWKDEANDNERCRRLEPYKHVGIENLYLAVVHCCRHQRHATITAAQLQALIPRPLNPQPGILLGTAVVAPLSLNGPEDGNNASDPRSRRGTRFIRREKSAKGPGKGRHEVSDQSDGQPEL